MIGSQMTQAPVILLIILGLLAIFTGYLSAWAYLRKRVNGAKEFSLLLSAISLYSLGYMIEISKSDVESILEAIKFEYIGLAFIPTFTLFFAIRFVSKKPVNLFIKIPLILISVATIIIVFTMQHHKLFYINPIVSDGGFFPVLKFEQGLWYYVEFIYIEIVSMIAVILLCYHIFKTDKNQKIQSIFVALGSIIPWVGAVTYFFRMLPGQIDSGPLFLGISALVYAVSLFKLGMFELVPVARELAIDSIHDMFIVVNNDGRIQDINRAARNKKEFGLMIGKSIPNIFPFADLFVSKKDEIENIFEFSIDDEYGVMNFYEAKTYEIYKKKHNLDGHAIIISDITDKIKLLNQLKENADKDQLTGIYNRYCLIEFGIREIEFAKSSKHPLSIIMIDIDYFKNINDTYGHLIGDKALKFCVSNISRELRGNDIFGRYGGEEFILILPNTNIENAVNLAERLRNSFINSNMSVFSNKVRFTASFGVAQYNENETFDDIINKADKALYKAKQTGRNRVCTF